VLPPVDKEDFEPSVLADFDAAYVLDALSCGIVVLDKQLCTVYANVIAQDLLALQLPNMRGRPLAHLLPQPQHFDCAVRRALEGEAAVACMLTDCRESRAEGACSFGVRIVPLHSQMSGAYVLVEVSARTCAQSQEAAIL
jgi:PAS domain-containing protein